MQVTTEYVQQACLLNAIPKARLYTLVAISVTKRGLAQDIPDDYRMKFLNQLDRMAGYGEAWLTAGVIAAVGPMCDAGWELYREAAKLDREKPGRPGFLDALAKFFPAFAVLNPSLMTALEMQPGRNGHFHEPQLSEEAAN